MSEQDDVLQSEVVQKHIGKLQSEHDKKVAELTKKLEESGGSPEASKVLVGATEEFNKVKKELDESRQRESLVVAAQEFYAKFENFGVKLSELLTKSSAKEMLDYCAEQAVEYDKQREEQATKVVHAGTGAAGAGTAIPNLTPLEAIQMFQEEAEKNRQAGKPITRVTINPWK